MTAHGPRLELDDNDQARLDGAEGPAMALAMRTVVTAANILAARSLVPITFAHLDACFYAGHAHVDFARYLLDHKARFSVPTWTNSGTVSLANPESREADQDRETWHGARKLMQLYQALGCRPVWTCAPYQLPGGPRLGDHIAAGESNAVAFYNSVTGARTNKYGDYLDAACALTGKAPLAGLHTDEGRRGGVLFNTDGINGAFKREDTFFHLLGHCIGQMAGQRIPVIQGLPADAGHDGLKALSAAGAASGGVEMWHGVGVTPEANSQEQAFGGEPCGDPIDITPARLAGARDELSAAIDGPIDMVALGTPHFSLTEFAKFAQAMDGRAVAPGVKVYISTSRFVRDAAAQNGWIAPLEQAGVTIIADTCTYFSPAVRGCRGKVMTNSAKWAWYAPGLLGVEVCFGSLGECALSAAAGQVCRDDKLWRAIS